jgi:hypothetical protein
MEEIMSNSMLSLLASICATFFLGAALVFFCKRDAEKHWRSMGNE